MTTLHWRGVPYVKEEQHARFMNWWNFVHRATLWLTYRGVKYRPAQLVPVPVYTKNQ